MHKANKLRIVPIIIGECKWKSTFLGALQALPKDELLPFAHSNPDLFYTNVATEVEAIAKASLEVPPPPFPPPWLRKFFNRLKNIHISFSGFIITPKLLAALLATLSFASALPVINHFQPKEYKFPSKRSSCVNSDITDEILITYLEQGAYGECRHHTIEAETDTDLKKMVSAAEMLYEINAKNIKDIQYSVENAKPKNEQFMPLYQQVRGTLYLYKGLYQNSNYLKNALADFKTAHENYRKQYLIYSEQMALALQAGSCFRPAALSEDSEKILIGDVGNLIRKQINNDKGIENNVTYFDLLNAQLPWQKERPEAEKENTNLKITQCVEI